ncbi:MAG: DUF3592 domain-containing protein [bacterium]|nr:DUF3592 domain-containing protein [bacterium]
MTKTSKVRKAKSGGCLMVGFFGIFAVAGGAMFYYLSWKPISNIVAARGWVETECVIVSSEVGVHAGSDGSTYSIDIKYTYEVDWQTYRGDRYNFSIGSSSGYEGKNRVVEAHPPGSEAACYYDTDDPTRSVINRSPGHYLWWGLFPIPFLAVGLGGLIFLLTPAGRRKAGSRDAKQDRRPRAASLADVSAPRRYDPAEIGDGPLELDAQASPTMKIVGTLVFAAFWNGIVSVFVFGEIVPSFRSGDVAWFTTIFMIPFVLVGIFAILFFLYQVLAFFNPRPQLTLADGHLTPGCETSLRWSFGGRAGRIGKLTIELEGQEKARYRRGTSTHTDEHVFFSRELVSSERFESIHRGNAELALPERTMPTFDSPNNDIEWRLKVRGDIPFWPDVIEDFPITVYPGRPR